jgi:hypothetical protein
MLVDAFIIKKVSGIVPVRSLPLEASSIDDRS